MISLGKRILATALLTVFIVSAGNADISSWVDENGVRHFGNREPPSDARDARKIGEIKSPEAFRIPNPGKIIQPANGQITVDLYRDLAFTPKGWPMGLSTGHTAAAGLFDSPGEKLAKEPRYRSDGVMYGYLPLGNGRDRKISFAVDEIERPKWSVYMDANNNEDLTDDGPAMKSRGTGKFASDFFVEMEVADSAGKKRTVPYMVWMWINERKLIPNFYAKCHYSGVLSLNGSNCRIIAFEQGKHDGLLRESGVWIDLDRDGKSDPKTEHFFHRDIIRTKTAQYVLNLRYP